MIFYSDKSVYEAAKERIAYLFDEFYPQRKIVVGFSGGKDSTAVLQLTHEVMVEKGIKDKLPVMFLDQELEIPLVIDHIREVMHYDWVEPYWVQSYFREWNGSKGDWFNVWGIGEKWVRPKEDIALKDIDFEVKESFGNVLECVNHTLFGDDYIKLGGVRIEESPARRMGLTHGNVYKNISWGRKEKRGLVFYPIWDWKCNDVWYYIFSKGLPYCKVYNYYFTKYPLAKCRVSSFIHENSIQNIKDIKEICPEFYEKALARIENINTTVQSYSTLVQYAKSLPPYFENWTEYVEYLAEHIVYSQDKKEILLKKYHTEMNYWYKMFGKWEYGVRQAEELVGLATVHAIIAEDYGLSKVRNVYLTLIKIKKENESRIEAANRAGV